MTKSQAMYVMALCSRNITSYFKNKQAQRAHQRFRREFFSQAHNNMQIPQDQR